MALSPDNNPGSAGFQPEARRVLPSSQIVFDASVQTEIQKPRPVIESLLFSSPTDPAREQLTREERIRLHYAQQLAEGDLASLTPRYKASDYDSQNPFADSLTADPLSDPEVSRLASIIKASHQERVKKD